MEFGDMAAYLCKVDNDGETENAAFGVFDSQADRDEILANADSCESFTQGGDDLDFTDSVGIQSRRFPAGDGVYYRIMVEPGREAGRSMTFSPFG